MKVKAILETCLYAVNLEETADFYSDVLGLEAFAKRAGRHVFFRCGTGVLLIFNPEHTSNKKVTVNGDIVPLHGARGEGHVCFKVRESEMEEWREWLKEKKVEIESEVTWDKGNTSLYFRDPAGNCLEVASPQMWGLPEV